MPQPGPHPRQPRVQDDSPPPVETDGGAASSGPVTPPEGRPRLSSAEQRRALAVRLLRFAWRVLLGFDRNNGFVLAGAMAYSAILSVVPLALLLTALLSTIVEPDQLMLTVRGQLRGVLLPGQARMLVDAVDALVRTADVGGVFGGFGLLFFATTGFRVLQSAFAQIFEHRHLERSPRGLLASMAMSIGFIVALGLLLLARIALGHLMPLSSGWLEVVGSFVSVSLVMAGIYRVVPVGGLRWRASLSAGALVAAVWEVLVQGLNWYFASISSVNVVYGSMAAVILILITVEYAAAIVLIGAQAIAEVERSRYAGLPWYEAPLPRESQLR